MPETHNSPLNTFFNHKMVNEAAIEAAIADLKTQMKLNFGGTTFKFEIDPKMLKWCFETNNVSKTKIQLDVQRHFNIREKQVFMECINTLLI